MVAAVALHQQRLGRSGSNESLFLDLSKITNAEYDVVAQCIGSREKAEKGELQRVLGHLPVVRENQRDRHSQGVRRPLSARCGSGRAYPKTPAPGQADPLPTSARMGRGLGIVGSRPSTAEGTRPPPQGDSPQHQQQQQQQQQQHQRPAATPRPPTPGTGGVYVRSRPSTAQGRPRSARGVTPGTARRPASASASLPGSSRGSTSAPRPATNEVVGPPLEPPMTAAETGLRPQSGVEKKLNKYEERLAELGIDPEGMAASEILKLFYARGDSTTYRTMQKEVFGHIAQRPHTPLSLRALLTARACDEVRRARDLPVTMVHDCLDKWEIETLADVCRSLHHYEEQRLGAVSEYSRGYGKTVFGYIDRKPYVRQPV